MWECISQENKAFTMVHTNDVYTLMTDLSQSVLGLLSFIVAILRV